MKKNLYGYLKPVTAKTAADMAIQAELNFTVRKVSLKFTDSNNNDIVIPNKVAIVRDDTDAYLETVGSDYGIVQFEKMLDFTEILVEEGEAEYLYGGPLEGGRRAVVAMRTPDKILLGHNDEIECIFNVATSHDCSIGLDIIPTPFRKTYGTVMGLPEEFGRFTFKHTKYVNERMEKARISIAKVKSYWEMATKSFDLMKQITLTPERLEEYWKIIITTDSTRADNIRERIDTIFKTHPAYQFPATKNTLLGAYLAVCEWSDNEMGTRVTKKRNATEEDAKIKSLIDGQAAKRKSEAFAAALKLQKMFGGGNSL